MHTEITDYLTENLDDYLTILEKMVGVNSWTANPPGINKLGEMTAEIFAPLGFSAEFEQSYREEFGRHLIMTKQGSGESTIGLVTHLDTVFSEEEEKANDFAWRKEVHDGRERIYGPGTNDIKGGTVGIYMMLDAIRKFAPEVYERTNWVILADAAEEWDALDFGEICRDRLAGAKAALIFEAGHFDGKMFKILVKRKGSAVFNVKITGRSSHAGSKHEEGANALVQAAAVVQKLAAITDYEKDVTVSVGTLQGGTVTNRVPHFAEINLEMRAYERDVYDDAMAQIMALDGYSSVKAESDGFPCKVTVTCTRKTPPWPRNAGTDGLAKIWAQAAETIGFETIESMRGGLSDGNMFFHLVPTLDALGPSGLNAHCSERSEDGAKDQEYVLTDSFVPKTVLNTVAVLDLLEDE